MRALKARVIEKEPNDIAMPGTRSAGESFDVAPNQRTKPAPAAAERSLGTGLHLTGARFTGEEAPRKHADHG